MRKYSLFTKRKLTTLSLTGLIFLSSFAAMCDSSKDAKRAAITANDIQTVVDTTVDGTTQLYNDKILSKVKAHAIALALQKINNANQILITTARAMKSDSTTNKCLLATQLLNVANAVKELQDLGLIGIKSANGKLIFDIGISSLIADVKILASIIGPCAESVNKFMARLEVEQNGFSSNSYTN